MQIRVENVQYTYPGEVYALKGITFLIKPGEQVALVGENGSGKSTLARHLNGLLQPQSGFVQVGDWLSSDHSPAQMAFRVAYVFQNPDEQIFKQKVWDEVAFGPRQLGFSPSLLDEAVEQALAQTGMAKHRHSHPHDLGYSSRKLIAIASALAMQTPVIIFDEPTSGLDSKETNLVSNILLYLREQKHTCIVISHDMDFIAENLDRILFLNDGKLEQDAPIQDFFSNSDLIRESGLIEPQLIRLSKSLGLNGNPIKVDEFLTFLQLPFQH